MKLLYRTGDYAFIIGAKGHLFVTVFALNTASNTAFNTLVNPDSALVLAIMILYHD